jgi:hypothetical protein
MNPQRRLIQKGQNVQLQGQSPFQGFRFRKRRVIENWLCTDFGIEILRSTEKDFGPRDERAALLNRNVRVTGMMACRLTTPQDELCSPMSGFESHGPNLRASIREVSEKWPAPSAQSGILVGSASFSDEFLDRENEREFRPVNDSFSTLALRVKGDHSWIKIQITSR